MPPKNQLEDYDKEILTTLDEAPIKIGKSIEQFKFREALKELINLARLGNKYLADTEPWKLSLVNKKRTETIMNIAIQITISLSILSEPFMPFSSKKLKKILNVKTTSWDDAGSILINKKHKINQANLLFKKIEDEQIAEQLAKLNL